MTESRSIHKKKPEVIVIDPTAPEQTTKLRIAAYARVSSDSDDQENSFAAQVRAYTELITSKPEWELADIYADEGITGTCTDKREDFLRLMRDCRKGKIDRVITKSISRFSRNSMDCLKAVRELRSLGVGVYFEKENINTSALSDELMLTFFASCAQQESVSISGNMRLGCRMRMKQGTYVAPSTPYGYTLMDNLLEIEPEQADVVRKIFDWYLSGKGMNEIAVQLEAEGICCKGGKSGWNHTSVSYILQNERYIGDKLLQKTFATETLPFRQIKNRGEKDRYYVSDAHSPIIEREKFEQAQLLIAERKRRFIKPISGIVYPLTRRIQCGFCGTTFRRKVTNDIVYWVCERHDIKGAGFCANTQIPETKIYAAFLRMYHKFRNHREDILIPMRDQLLSLREHRHQGNTRLSEINREVAELIGQVQTLGNLKNRGVLNEALYHSQFNILSRKINTLKSEKNRLFDQEGDDTVLTETSSLIDFLEESPEWLRQFDSGVFENMVGKVMAEPNGTLRFRLVNGLEISEQLKGRCAE